MPPAAFAYCLLLLANLNSHGSRPSVTNTAKPVNEPDWVAAVASGAADCTGFYCLKRQSKRYVARVFGAGLIETTKKKMGTYLKYTKTTGV